MEARKLRTHTNLAWSNRLWRTLDYRKFGAHSMHLRSFCSQAPLRRFPIAKDPQHSGPYYCRRPPRASGQRAQREHPKTEKLSWEVFFLAEPQGWRTRTSKQSESSSEAMPEVRIRSDTWATWPNSCVHRHASIRVLFAQPVASTLDRR